jgi:outer membrane receptor for ferrienterochelin and colicins
MKFFKNIFITLFILNSFIVYCQTSEVKKVKITGTVLEKVSNKKLEFATVSLINATNLKQFFSVLTDNNGEFVLNVSSGVYDVKIEFISFETKILKQKEFIQDVDLGIISLSEKNTQLNEVKVISKTSAVEIKLDKKIYNVGQDLTVKGGNATDVLNNVPSVTVDADGNVSLRGNDSVRILIDGKPSNAINVATALQAIPADALDKVEVISNPSSRYDAEGSAGIINIILKKGKNDGLNGSVILTTGIPKNNSLSANVNFKSKIFNIYSTFGYIDSEFNGNTLNNTDYLNFDGSIKNAINELNTRTRAKKGINLSYGIDLNLSNSIVWSNGFNYNRSNGYSPENNLLSNFLPTGTFTRNRFNNQSIEENDVSFNTAITKKFKKEGHKLSANASFSIGKDYTSSLISDFIIGQENIRTNTSTLNNQDQSRNLFQVDYVLPFGKNNQLEMGYKTDFNQLKTNFNVSNQDSFGNFISDPNFTNIFQYKEKINAVYSQFGTKIKKFSFLVGLRFENSNIDINLIQTNNFINKNYNNLFPSAFITYSLSDNTNLSLNYSRRITRPRNRFINPFAGYTSNINIFQGNPDINPSITNSLDFGLLTKINKFTVTSSLYYNYTKDIFQFTRRPSGNFVTSIVNGQTISTPILISSPVNLSYENRLGFEFTLNYSLYKWWKLNSNFNFFQSSIVGDFSIIDLSNNQLKSQKFDVNSSSWFTKLNSKINLPYKIDWQTNAVYTAAQVTSQGKSLATLVLNLAFSKDVLKEKATISLNVNDLFNSAKMIRQFNLATANSYSEMQRRERQINLSFTYRFNKKKTEKESRPKQDDGGGDY